ncbi:two pore domain potassium channel family protein [Streptomyces sp. NPDC048644]|uniref:two pore domain potassium channel family protein n=1 Tax=Streptomyces sp. NPDC048644 TaxID=3365582 RepID=UPI003713ECE7
MDREERLRTWEGRVDPYLLAASLLFLTAYAVRVLMPGLSPGWLELWAVVTVVSWATFVVEYLARLAFSPDRRRFVRTRWLDLVVTVLPLLRPLRLVELHDRMCRNRSRPQLALEARVMAYTGLASLLLGFAAAPTVLHDERHAPGSHIRTLGEAASARSRPGWCAASGRRARAERKRSGPGTRCRVPGPDRCSASGRGHT